MMTRRQLAISEFSASNKAASELTSFSNPDHFLLQASHLAS